MFQQNKNCIQFKLRSLILLECRVYFISRNILALTYNNRAYIHYLYRLWYILEATYYHVKTKYELLGFI